MSAPLLSVVIPTYNEEANIGPLLRALRESLAGLPYEAIVVDDDSKDATAANARADGARVIVRLDERGLATAVVRGLREARGTYVAVMDADFQHPPATIRALLEKAMAENADLAIGTRYAPGGSEGSFGPLRRTISWGAALIGQVALPPIRRFGVTDPMSGLFLVRRAAVDVDALRPHGYKILLEILGRCRLERVVEVPFTFEERRGGESKLGAGVMVQYVRHMAVLGWDHPENRRAASFALVGLSGVVVNLGLFSLLLWLFGIDEGRDHLAEFLALAVAIEASILSNFFLNDRFTFRDRRHDHVVERLAKFNAVSLLALVVNLSAYAILTRGFGLPAIPAEALAIVVPFGANYLGNLHWTYGGAQAPSLRSGLRKAAPWLPFLVLAGAAAFVYFDDLDRVPELYFDEHYYVSVGRQIDNGIWEDPCWVNDQELDHRPLNYEHPPLAKYLIAWSIMRFDTDHAVFEGCRSPDDTNASQCDVVQHGQVVASTDSRKACYDAYVQRAKEQGNPVAWRLPSATLGVATVLFIALAAQRLFGTTFAGMLAGTLVLMDTLLYSSARLAILDIFAAGFLAMAVYAATFPSRKGVLATAALLGLAFSCKYSVVFAGPAVALISLWSQRRAGVLTRRRFDLNLAAYTLVPLAIWVAMYLPWWMLWIPEMGFAEAVRHWIHVQGAAFKWGAAGYQVHSYSSQPPEWIPISRPTFYYHVWGFSGADAGKEGWVYAVGNPLLWWSFSAAAVGAVVVPLFGWAQTRLGYRLGERGSDSRPGWVTAAVVLLVVRGALLLAAGFVALVLPSAFPTLPALFMETLLVTGAVLTACGGLSVFLAFRVAKGDNRARLASIALAGLLGAFSVFAALGGGIEGYVLLAMDVLIIVALVMPASLVWFAGAGRLGTPIGPLAYFRSQPRDAQATVLAAILALSTYGFFFLVGRVTFLFYMTVIVPLGCLALGGVLHLMWQRSWADRIVAAVVVVGVLASCLFYLPVAAADRITPEHFQRIMDTVPWMRE